MNILCLLILTLPLAIKLRWDYVAWLAKKHINHPQRLVLIGALMVLLSFVVWRIAPAKYFIQPLFLSVSIFFMFFDYIVNLQEGRSWFFIPDKDDQETSWTDRNVYAPIGVWKLLLARV